MKTAVAQQLIEVNRAFYQTLADPFSATRGRLQPGVQRVLAGVPSEANVLDLGCGNGGVARELVRREHRGKYVGVDGSKDLLEVAKSKVQDSTSDEMGIEFIHTDITSLNGDQLSKISGQPFDYVFAFAVLHHIPSQELRMQLLKHIHNIVKFDGQFVHSNWQFLNSSRLRERIQPWSKIGLDESDVDPGDYLLDWRSGGTGLRYVHQFSETELSDLATECGFVIQETFLSDGMSGDLSLYSVWVP